MSTQTTDPRAEIGTVRRLTDRLLDSAADLSTYCCDTGPLLDPDDAETLARAMVAGFVLVYERKDGLRRPVLYGDWEVDPAVVAGRG